LCRLSPCDCLPWPWLFPSVWLLVPPSLCSPVSHSPLSNHLRLPVYVLIPSVASYSLVRVFVFPVWSGLWFLELNISLRSNVGVWVLLSESWHALTNNIMKATFRYAHIAASNILKNERQSFDIYSFLPICGSQCLPRIHVASLEQSMAHLPGNDDRYEMPGFIDDCHIVTLNTMANVNYVRIMNNFMGELPSPPGNTVSMTDLAMAASRHICLIACVWLTRSALTYLDVPFSQLRRIGPERK